MVVASTDEPAGPDLSQQAASGVLWMTAQKWVVRLLGLLTIAILTRFLRPEDFGMVAAASTVLPFLYLLADLGFAAYIVQAAKADTRTLGTAFWFSVGTGAALSTALWGAAPAIGMVFADPRVTPVLQVLSLSVVITALSSVPTALLRRSMRFRAVAGATAAGSALGQLVAVWMALVGNGVWALVAQTLVAHAVTCVLVMLQARWLPSFVFDRHEFIRMSRFGIGVLGVEVVAVSRAWVEAAIVSNVLGLAALGYLSIAQRLVQIVQDLTGSALVPVTQVAFARIRDSAERLRNAYVRALRLTYTVMSPPLILLAVTAPIIMPIVFGNGWAPSYPVAQILALAATVTIGASLDHGLFYGLGRPGRWFAYALAVDLLTVAVTALTADRGLVAITTGFLFVAVLATVARWFLVSRLLQAMVREVAAPFVLLAAAVLAGAPAGLGALALTSALHPVLAVAIVGLVILAVHLAVVRLAAPRVFSELARIMSRIPGFARRNPSNPADDT